MTDRRPLALARELWRRSVDDQCGAWAAALAFFVLLSIVPLLLCGIAALGATLHDPHEAAVRVFEMLRRALPGRDAGVVAERLLRAARVEETAAVLIASRGWAAWLGVVSLVWTASRVFVNATTPMNAAFRAVETRGWLRLQATGIGLLLGAGGLAAISVWGAWADGLWRVGAPIASVAGFTLVYRLLPTPSAHVAWRASAIAGIVAAALWEVVKEGFAAYFRRFGGDLYDRLYGGLGGAFLLAIWAYYASLLLLLGAELASLLSDLRARGPRPDGVTGAG